MTPTTSSSSVHGTTEEPKPDRTGKPPIGMLFGRTSLSDNEFRWWSLKVQGPPLVRDSHADSDRGLDTTT